MPRGIPAGKSVALPELPKFVLLEGDPFVKLRHAARLSGLPPAVLEMATELLTRSGKGGAAFPLSTPELRKQARDIEQVFLAGLNRVASAFGHRVKAKSFSDQSRLVFWYEEKQTRAPRAH